MSGWVGRSLGKVRIESLLARGGMAEVYLGTHTTLERTVAVKILHIQNEENEDSLERFQREARVVAKLRHPNIVQVFDFDSIDNHPFLVMEYVQGPSLSKYLRLLHRDKKRLEIPQVLRIIKSLASALQYAHDMGMIHRDIKPGNILLTSRSSQIEPGKPLPADFEPILTDFGLVRFLDSSHRTTVGQVAGTPAYMSPEQARGELTDGRTDVYSLGILLYEVLAGELPFDGETTMSILLKHISDPPMPIPGLSPSMQAVLDRALAKHADGRFQTSNELACALEAAVEGIAPEPSTLMVLDAVQNATPILGVIQPVELLVPSREIIVPSKPRRRWIPTVLASVVIFATGAAFLLKGISPVSDNPQTATPASATMTATAVKMVASSLGPTGVLHFQDGSAIMDQVVLSALAMPAPPAGSQYEVWLVGEKDSLNLGILSLDANGKGTLIYHHPDHINLLSLYSQVQITIKPIGNSSPATPDRIAYSYALPPAGLDYLRRLLVSFPPAPKQVALVQGLSAEAQAIDQAARDMLSSYESGDEAGVREKAEDIMNLLVGHQSADFKDWNRDTQIKVPEDGYGFLLNGDNLGFIQAIYSHADYAVNAPGATQNMIINGEYVKTCAQNLAQWAPQLHDRLLAILASSSLSEMDQPVRDSVSLADQMLKGIDANQNGKIEPISGECGVTTLYDFAYRMADMPLLPLDLTDLSAQVIGTPIATSIAAPSASSGGNGSGNPSSSKPKKTPPGQNKKDHPNNGNKGGK